MTFDAHLNFAASLVAGAPGQSGLSLSVTPGDGVKFPAPPFNMVAWPVLVQPTDANAEIVRVTGVATDTFTILRAQEGSTQRNIALGFQIAAGPTVKTFTDIESVVAANTTAISGEVTRAEAAEALKAPLASPTFTGAPTAPTQTSSDSSTKLATTALVDAKVTASGGVISGSPTAGTAAVGGEIYGSVPSNTTASDLLNRAVENPLRDGSNWAVDPTYGLDLSNTATGQMTSPTSALNAGDLWQPTLAADQEASCPVVAIGVSTTWAVIKLRWTSSASFYRLKFQPTGAAIFNGSGTELTQTGGSGSATIAAGDSILGRAYGTTIEAWHLPSGGSWTLVFQAIDQSAASGVAGFAVSDPTVVLGPPIIGPVSETSGASWSSPAGAASFNTFIKDGDIYSVATKNGVIAGSGAADQSGNIATFLGNAIAANKVAVFPPGDYVCNTSKYINGIPRILGDGARILAGQTNDQVWNFYGGSTIGTFTGGQLTAYGAKTVVSADVGALGATLITLPAGVVSTLAVGDVIVIGDTTTLIGGNSGTNTVAAQNAYKIYEINSGTTVTLSEPLIYPMLLANNAYVLTTPTLTAATGAQGGFVHGLFFQGTAAGAGNAASTAGAMTLWSLRNMDIECSAQGLTNAGFVAAGLWQSRYKLTVSDFADVGVTFVAGQYGYGFDFSGPSGHCDAHVIGNRCRHTITFSGTGHNCWGHGEAAGNTSTNFDMHAGFTSSGYDGIHAHGGGGPIAAMRGSGYRVLNATGWQTAGGGIYIFDVPANQIIQNLNVYNPISPDGSPTYAVRVDESCPGLSIQGGRWVGCGHGVLLNLSETVSDLTVQGVSALNLLGSAGGSPANEGFLVYMTTSSAINRAHIVGNAVDDNQGSPTTTGVIYANSSSITHVNVQGNDLGAGISNTAGPNQGLVNVINPVPFTPVLTNYAASTANRVDTVTVTNGSPTVLDASILATDVGRTLSGTGIPGTAYVGTVTPGVSFLLSSSPASQSNINATASGTSVTLAAQYYAIPAGATKLLVTVIGAGGGGGSGGVAAAGTQVYGGAGGAGGGMVQLQFPVSGIASPVAVTVPPGGAGGAAQATNSSSGNSGIGGGYASFGGYARAAGGGNGPAGGTTSPTSPQGGSGLYQGSPGEGGGTTNGNGANTGTASGGGGAGGGVNTSSTPGTGGGGAYGYYTAGELTAGGAGAIGGAGGVGVAPTLAGTPGQGGGGGGSSAVGAGGAGGTPVGSGGGGGGGGGSALNSNGGSGAGGNGATGSVVIYAT